MTSTADWAESLGISTKATPPSVRGYTKRYPRSARQIAVRAVILQGVVAVACGVDAEPVIDWFHRQRIWRAVTALEKRFLQAAFRTKDQCRKLGWHQEAEWTLLWTIRKVDSLGLPTHGCDTRRLCQEIIPALGSDIAKFVASAKLRQPGVLLAEDDRTYNLWCYTHTARHQRKPVPKDLNCDVLYERRYAFEWLDGHQDWDDVTCDS